jgi:transposase
LLPVEQRQLLQGAEQAVDVEDPAKWAADAVQRQLAAAGLQVLLCLLDRGGADHVAEGHGAEVELTAVAQKLGIGTSETLRKWVRRAEIDDGRRPGLTSEEHAEIKRLKREVAELRRANEILKAASAFFAAELDRPQPRS